MDFAKLKESAARVWIFGGLAALAVMLVVFQLGRIAGYRMAGYAYRHDADYARNFGGTPQGGFGPGGMMAGRGYPTAHGTFGRVASISQDGFVMDDGGTEHVITVDATTRFRLHHDTVPFSTLKIDDQVVVIGEPDDQGRIAAKVVRIEPAAAPQP